jgi:hypothetical protein
VDSRNSGTSIPEISGTACTRRQDLFQDWSMNRSKRSVCRSNRRRKSRSHVSLGVVGANGFEPSTSWSRTRVTKILSALSGAASGPGPDFLPLLIVRRLSVNWVTNGNGPQIYASRKVNHLQFVLHAAWACDSAKLLLPLALGFARFQHFPPQKPVCLGLVAWATLF